MRCIRLLTTNRGVSIRSLTASRLDQYAQESYEAAVRFRASETYPGAIRAATPGDTKFYLGKESVLHGNERHYWRAVVDDPQVEHVVTLRIRFKNEVWVTTGWETRMHVVQVTVPRSSTIADLIEQVRIDNQSPYVAQKAFRLCVDGKDLAEDQSVEQCQLNELTFIDAYDVAEDHVRHLPSHRPLDWTHDELSDSDLQTSPYKEMHPAAGLGLIPRYEARPEGYKGKRNYGGPQRQPSNA